MKIWHLYCIAGMVMFLNCIVAFPQQITEIQRIRECLYPAGKPIGQPFTSRQTDIRMLRVDSYQEARSFFMNLCRGSGKLQMYSIKTFTCYRYTLSGNKGHLIFTDKVKPKRNETAVLWVSIDSIGVKEIHFVETTKIKSTSKNP